MKRILGIVCSLVLTAALTQNKQVRIAETDAPDSTRNKDRTPPPHVDRFQKSLDRAEIVSPDSVDNRRQYEKR